MGSKTLLSVLITLGQSRSQRLINAFKERRCSLHVAVGMSGGVDSSVSAHLLKDRGHLVTGVFMRNWDTQDETGVCTIDQDLEHARHAAQVLDIELREVDFSKEYWNHVFAYVLHDYENGRTPNPDIVCNQLIKFDVFLKHAKDVIGADALATGHYVQSNTGDNLEHVEQLKKTGQPLRLFKGVDPGKDQSFFLSRISQTGLAHSLFPVGALLKKDVKKMASEIGLSRIATKDESMGICFIGSRRFKSFINDYIAPAPGNFVHIDDGRVIGQHSGVHQWTIGQRLKMGGCRNGPLCVVSRDTNTNDITVADGSNHPSLYSYCMEVETPYWISGETDPLAHCDSPLAFRFQHNNVGITHPCHLLPVDDDEFQDLFHSRELSLTSVTGRATNKQTRSTDSSGKKFRYIVKLSEPMRALTPGQFAVLYRGDECLGSSCIIRPGPSLWDLSKDLSKDGYEEDNNNISLSRNLSQEFLNDLDKRRKLEEEKQRKISNSNIKLDLNAWMLESRKGTRNLKQCEEELSWNSSSLKT